MSKSLRGAAELLMALHQDLRSTIPLPEIPDPDTASDQQLASAISFIAAQESKGFAFGGVPGCLWAGALITAPETPALLDGPPLINAGSTDSPQWRWGRAPVLYLGDPTPLRIPAEFRETDSSASLLWRSALWGSLPEEIEGKVLHLFRSLGHLMMRRAPSVWPLPASTRKIVQSASTDLDRWLLFCLLASLCRTSHRSPCFRLEARIAGMPEPIEASIADLRACHPTPAVRRRRSGEFLQGALGQATRIPPLNAGAKWLLVAETTTSFELAAEAAVQDLVRGPAAEDAPDDLIRLKAATKRFERSDRTLRTMIERGQIRDYRRPDHGRTAPILLSARELEFALSTPTHAG